MATGNDKKTQREDIILNLLHRKKSLRTNEVARTLHVSECTVRRIFQDLEECGEAVRVYGGINSARDNGAGDYQFENLQLLQSEQKQRLGRYAGQIIKNGDVFYMDSGTTMQQMALYLTERIRRRELTEIQVYTNSLRNLSILVDYCDVNLIGGLFRKRRQDFCGYLSELVLESISFEKCFLGADGINSNPQDGIMAMDIFSAKVSQAVIRRAASAYIIADSTKFSRRSFIKYASLDQVKAIITTQDVSDENVREISAFGPEVIRV